MTLRVARNFCYIMELCYISVKFLGYSLSKCRTDASFGLDLKGNPEIEPFVLVPSESRFFSCVREWRQEMRIRSPGYWFVAFLSLLVGANSTHAAVPKITTQPVDLTVQIGDSAVFSVVGSGYDSLRWFRNGARIPQSTTPKLVLKSALLSDDGAGITCVLYNGDGGAISREAVLRVLRPSRELVTVTGELSDRTGALIGSNGKEDQNMVIEVFSQLEGGDTLYSEAFLSTDGKAVQVGSGKFVVRLGTGRILKGNLASLAREKQTLYLQFSLGQPDSRESLEPRLPITATPYALAGDASILKGNGTPIAIGLTAPVGAWYVDNLTGKTWFRTFRNWVLSQ